MSSADSFDVIIIGCGAMGAAACHHLARRGARVLAIEQFGLGHSNGSSHGHSRVIRQAYFEHPDYVPLLLRTYELFEELEQRSGSQLLLRCGALFGGRADSEVVAGSQLAAERHGIPHELFDAAAIRTRFPQFALPDDYVALFEPGAGCVCAEATTHAHVQLARTDGAVVLEQTCVRAWTADEHGVHVTTGRGTFHGSQLIVTAGPWSARVLAAHNIPLEVTRQPMIWLGDTDHRQRERHTMAQLPVWLIDRHDGTSVYGIPFDERLGGPAGMKVALHGGGGPFDPEAGDREVAAGEIAAARHAATAVLPNAGDTVVGTALCMYTCTPDRHFIIDRLPASPRVSIACGFSGHGFKFAPVVGEALADLALRGATELPIGFLGMSRFRESP